MIHKNITIEVWHEKWLVENNKKLSSFVRDKIDSEIKGENK